MALQAEIKRTKELKEDSRVARERSHELQKEWHKQEFKTTIALGDAFKAADVDHTVTALFRMWDFRLGGLSLFHDGSVGLCERREAVWYLLARVKKNGKCVSVGLGKKIEELHDLPDGTPINTNDVHKITPSEAFLKLAELLDTKTRSFEITPPSKREKKRKREKE